jgi:hypothetical protein
MPELPGFDQAPFTHQGRTHQVYRAGAGQAVVVLPLEAIGRDEQDGRRSPLTRSDWGVLRSLPGRAIGPVRPRQAGAR